jgi:hypothetical protein
MDDLYGWEPLMEIACEKLCGSAYYDPSNAMQALAVLGARFCLDIRPGHFESDQFHTRAVVNHMRVLESVTLDRVWQNTRYPSEPLLACAAAELLQKHCIVFALYALHRKIRNGLIDAGNRGELVGRLLLLLAKDFCVRELNPNYDDYLPPTSWEVELLDCKPVPVIAFLETVFGHTIWDDNCGAQQVFANWYLNFSPWVSMSSKIWNEDEEAVGVPG